MADQNHSRTGGSALQPGEYLKRAMALEGLTATALAQELGVHAQTIYNVTTGKRPISSALAVKLAARFVEPVEDWLAPLMEGPATSRAAMSSTRGIAVAGLAGSAGAVEYAENLDGILVDREIIRLLAGAHGVSVTPFNPEQVQPASYDLTIGLIISRGFRSVSVADWRMILKHECEPEASTARDVERIGRLRSTGVEYGRDLVLGNLESVVILCREDVAFSTTYLAEVGSTASNAVNGLLVNHGFQVDPGYRGSITVTAMNMGQEPIRLVAGDKILSLAIRRLASPPDRAYRDDMARKVLRIAERVDRAFKNSFDYSELDGGTWKAKLRSFDRTFLGASLDEVENEAVKAILEALADRLDGTVDVPMTTAAGEALESVTINQEDFSALVHRFDGLDADLIAEARSHFRSGHDLQTLRDTLNRLGLPVAVAAVGLAEDETLGKHSE